MNTIIKKNGKVMVEYKRNEKYESPEKFMTYAKVSVKDNETGKQFLALIVADYTPRKKNAAVSKAETMFPTGFVYDYGFKVRVMDNGTYTTEKSVQEQIEKYKAEFVKSA